WSGGPNCSSRPVSALRRHLKKPMNSLRPALISCWSASSSGPTRAGRRLRLPRSKPRSSGRDCTRKPGAWLAPNHEAIALHHIPGRALDGRARSRSDLALATPGNDGAEPADRKAQGKTSHRHQEEGSRAKAITLAEPASGSDRDPGAADRQFECRPGV